MFYLLTTDVNDTFNDLNFKESSDRAMSVEGYGRNLSCLI